ncbi:M23 family metallopeptidase [Ramlibacter sp. XY19]|uniref:M23 family metallopeptidase n=1 Tax=Ramlibacter paludis TaxID=2908000 RepID=UPI0023DAC24E|nr:M23 family metallopeptidase [Ramlibacter paludis]MCG2595081.1 M23 family metallopeptidase [Ramlibacter paludis]
MSTGLRCAVLAAIAGCLLAGCEREPVRTTVIPPRHAASDSVAVAPPPVVTVPPATAPATPPITQAPLPTVRNPGDREGAELLAQRTLLVPVVGIAPERLADTYDQGRGQRAHEAMDILAPRGTPVVAVDNGRVAKLFTSKPGGLTVYHFDEAGRLAYYYAHLDRYADGLREGMELKRGDLVGYVGTTGNADPGTPHLHFAVFKLGPDKKWWQGEPVNPYPALRRAAPATEITASR